MDRNRHYTRLSIVCVLAFALFRTLVMGRTGLGDSESYYWAWSQRLDWSYYDHPPLVAWLIRLFTDIGGDTSFMVRLPSALLFLVIGWLFYRLAMELFADARVAFISILTFNLVPMFGIGALQMVPDIPSAVCYLAFVLLLTKLLKQDGPGWLWYILGFILGIGCLGKYFAILLVPCTIILVAAIPEYRHWFKRPEPYLMAVAALIAFSPVLIWNITNDWPSFRFHLMDRHSSAGFTLRNAGQLVGGQFLYVSPLYLIALLWAVWAGLKRAIAGDRRYAVLTAFSAPVLIFFYIICAWTNESEPHWPAFGYLSAIIIMAAVGLELWDRGGSDKARRAMRYFITAAGLAAIMFILFYIHVFKPILPIKPKYDIINEVYGWDKAGAQIEKIYNEKLDKNGFILAHHWVLCSQIMFSTADKFPVACINGRIDQFDFWDDEDKLKGKNALFVSDLRFEEPPDQLYHFENVEKVEEIPIERGGRMVRQFTIWIGRNYQGIR